MPNDVFSRRHPALLFSYFAAVISLCAFLRHPVCTAISFVCALAYALVLDPKGARKTLVCFCLPVFLLTALVNPAFNHRGTIILTVFPTGNALTLESVLYGAFSALMLAALILWFFSFSKVFTSDKIVWLTGRAFPVLSLLLSMTLRFIPQFVRRFRDVSAARKALVCESDDGKRKKRPIREVFSVFSTVVTLSLESAIVTSDSMKSRGYGLEGRSSYSLYRFCAGDGVLLSVVVLLFAAVAAANAFGAFEWGFYPSFGGSLLEAPTLAFQACFLLLGVFPLLIDGKEAVRWRSLRSAI